MAAIGMCPMLSTHWLLANATYSYGHWGGGRGTLMQFQSPFRNSRYLFHCYNQATRKSPVTASSSSSSSSNGFSTSFFQTSRPLAPLACSPTRPLRLCRRAFEWRRGAASSSSSACSSREKGEAGLAAADLPHSAPSLPRVSIIICQRRDSSVLSGKWIASIGGGQKCCAALSPAEPLGFRIGVAHCFCLSCCLDY